MERMKTPMVHRARVLLWLGFVLPTLFIVSASGQERAQFVGSETCGACHSDAAAAWAQSHHALAWTPATPDTVVADFDGTSFSHRGMTARFSTDGETYRVVVTEADGVTTDYRVHSVAGIEPLQQYLIETEPGRIQSFDVVWDTQKGQWFHLYPDAELPPSDALHWTGPYKNWNARCAECHATGFKKNYNAQTRSYASRQAEIGVGCEACHGPGSRHLDWAEGRLEDPGRALGFSSALDAPDAILQQCGACHALREAFGNGNPLPGTPFHDAFNLALLRPGAYHADGQILAEVYVYGSFLQSKMYAAGVTCLDCHDAHSARLLADGNALCVQCHNPAGDPRFAGLGAGAYDTPDHHFHTPGTPGAACASCHMIERTYMGVDGRRDHSFRIPRPDLAAATGSPDACTDCHSSQTPEWAAAQIEQWYPNSPHRGPHYGVVLAAGRADIRSAAADVAALAADGSQPSIVRATALTLLERLGDPQAADAASPLLEDADPLVRAAAVRLQRAARGQERVVRLVPLLSDPVAAVRQAAAQTMLGAPVLRFPDVVAQRLSNAMQEWRTAIANRLDFPETHLQLGGTALTMRNFPAAVGAFRQAVSLDPQQTDAWVMLVRLAAAMEGAPAARAVLAEALELNPESEVLRALSEQIPPQ